MLDGFHQQVSGVLRVRLDKLEDEGSALLPDVSAMASPCKESKPHQIPPKTAKPVVLSGSSALLISRDWASGCAAARSAHPPSTSAPILLRVPEIPRAWEAIRPGGVFLTGARVISSEINQTWGCPEPPLPYFPP